MNKILFQVGIEDIESNYGVALPIDNTSVVPVGKEWVVHNLIITNLTGVTGGGETARSNARIQYKLHILKSGEVPQTKNVISFYREFQKEERFHEHKDIRMSEGDKIVIFVRGGRLSISGYGEELPLNYSNRTLTALERLASGVVGGVYKTDTVVHCYCS